MRRQGYKKGKKGTKLHFYDYQSSYVTCPKMLNIIDDEDSHVIRRGDFIP